MYYLRLALALLTCLILSITGCGCGAPVVESTTTYNTEVAEDDPLLQHFAITHPGKEVIICARSDLNGDNTEDLVVIYQESKGKNMMLVVLDFAGEYLCTNEVPAPVSNQQIQLKDIDDKPPMEFIVHGMKGASVGYAIFRVEGTKLEDIFGENMKDCC